MMEKYKVKIKVAKNGDTLVPIPEELMKKYKIKPGDKLRVKLIKKGVIRIIPLKLKSKKTKKEKCINLK